MIKLIMSDMDGTLLDDDGRLPSGFDAMMAALKARHVMFAPASGRQYLALVEQFSQYRDDLLFVAENGTFVNYHEIEIFSSPMQPENVRAVLAAVEGVPDIYPVLCGKKASYVKSDYPPFYEEMSRYYTSHQLVDSFADLEDDILKVSFCDCDHSDAEHTIYPSLASFADRLQVAVSASRWVDVMNPDINKGVAVRQVQRILGIAPEECAAFGDYLNDLEMMSAVYYSFAMANAHPRIKEAARFQAKSNADGGVLLAIQDLIDQHLI